MLEFEGVRTELGSESLEPGTQREVLTKVLATSMPREHRLKLTLPQEGIAWFDESVFKSPTCMMSVSKD